MNFDSKNTFEKGYSRDLTENIEKKNTYISGLNGRLYSKNGSLSFSSIEGSKLVYENAGIVKWLGFHEFADEVIVFAKCTKDAGAGESQEEIKCIQAISTESFSVTADSGTTTPISLVSQFSDNSTQAEHCYTVVKPKVDPTDFELEYTEDSSSGQEVDFGEYYQERINVADYSICSINLNQVPINNETYYDMLLSFKVNEQGVFTGEMLWKGAQNWPLEGKITCEGVEENEFYKRVYYSDAVNPRRVLNRKDPSLANRNPKDFDQILDNLLLQPIVEAVKEGGQLKAMKSLYLYRIISENGQRSEFSPFSEFATVIAENDGIRYRGGDISETTGKMVTVKCNLVDPEPSSEIECIVLEFEALGPPTAIRNLGLKPADHVVKFDHYGNESEHIDDITMNDVLEFKNTWKYCNDFTSKKNKLIAGGLRNEPIPTKVSDLEYLLPLHAWDKYGATFSSLMNPKPEAYRFIDPTNTQKLIYVKQRIYESISSFGPMVLKFVNKSNGAEIEKSFLDLSLENYSNVVKEVMDWLLDEQANNPYFTSLFPNLKVAESDNKIWFHPIDDTIKTDLSNYVFESNNTQFIEEKDEDIVFLSPTVNKSKFVHGAESIGFNQGNGVRVTYTTVKEPLLKQATSVYNGNGKVLDYYQPSLQKFFMKGEIYRLAFQAYDKASSRFFAIPLGDIMVPELGDTISYLDNQGNAIITSKKYVNQTVENGILYGHGIKMKIEVRLDCEMQKLISMYQILYVERTEDNRTILCQGIAAPLQRIQDPGHDWYQLPKALNAKWTLPYYGGPTYERLGLDSYDQFGESYNYTGNGWEDRVMVNRRLMYFDSPDLYHGKISDQYLASSKMNVLAKLNTDHSKNCIMEPADEVSYRSEVYPKFSRKIKNNQLDGNYNNSDLPKPAIEEDESGTWESHFINVSVYAKYTEYKKEFTISKARGLNRGEVISGDAFDLKHDVSNNAMCLSSMPWYYSLYQKRSDDQDGRVRADLYKKTAMTSPGYSTAILKTTQDLFTDYFIGSDIYQVDPHIRLGTGGQAMKYVYDTIPLINIYRNNRSSVYGGRTAQAYSRNTFIPLSKTIPVSGNTGVQMFEVEGDTYVTLNIRTKNDGGEDEVGAKLEFNNGGGGRDRGDIDTWRRNGAWCYAVVLESQVEPKLSYDYQFYRETGTHKFEISRGENINEAYFSERNFKQFIPKPFKHRDDPNLGHIIAVSDVKISGENYDSWTVFKPNNFYAELEKNKGAISNIIRHKDDIYAIQEGQTSLIYIGTDRIINDANGAPINIKQGSGQVVDGHQIISSYGTSIRRAVAESDFGFSFFDEKHVEFIKINKPLLSPSLLHLHYWDQVKEDKIVDSECYFDHEKKETNIRVRTASGRSFLLSYNEMLQVFNGEFEYNNDLYIPFDKKVYSPVQGSPNLLHQLNEGDPLNLFGEQKKLKIEIAVNAEIDKIFLYRQLGLVTNLKYPIEQVLFKTSNDQTRIVPGTHEWYRFREGNHTIPAKNPTTDYDSPEIDELRGNWITAEITAESLNKNKIDILAIINNLRLSHQ